VVEDLEIDVDEEEQREMVDWRSVKIVGAVGEIIELMASILLLLKS
jgi:hypothetical protein